MTEPRVLSTNIGDLPLEEYHLTLEGQSWRVLHTGAIVSHDDEQKFLRGESDTKRPYGIVLWPSAIALAHELADRDLKDKRVLELGAGTGLPGIVAASRGARVVQVDRHEVALFVCKKNAERNNVAIEQRVADFTAWTDTDRYDVILGADILYASALHEHLRHILETNLAPNGVALLADPFRPASLPLLESMESQGWRISMSKWTVGITPPPRPVGVYELRRSG